MAFQFAKKSTVEVLSDVPKGLIGWIIGWNMRKNPAGYPVDMVKAAIEKHGLPQIAMPIRNRSAILRAMRAASKGEKKSLDILVDEPLEIKFQISHISLEDNAKYGKIAKYLADAVVTFRKDTMAISVAGDDDRVAANIERFVKDKFSVAKSNYTTINVTAMLRKLFMRYADIASTLEKGGMYLVPAKYKNHVLAVEKFLQDIGNRLSCYAVADIENNREEAKIDAFESMNQRLKDFKEGIDELREMDKEKDEDDKMHSDSTTKKKNAFKKAKKFAKKAKMWMESLGSTAEDMKKLAEEAEKYATKFFGAAE